jgi:quercetin dioxygenase-like cupin family protein
MTGTMLELDGLAWETWDDPALAARSPVRWKMVFSARRTPTQALSMGVAELAPGGVLPLHHHAPAEIYHVLAGTGVVEVDGTPYPVAAGASVFIPAYARHRSTCTGTVPLRVLFVFPTDSFEEIEYHWDE